MIHYPFDTAPAQGTATQVAPGILWIRLPLPMALDHVNVFALDDGDGWALIDTGCDTPQTRTLWRELMRGPLAGKPITRVIITHHHPDHVGLAGWFVAQGARLEMPRTAYLMARMLVLDEQATLPDTTEKFYQLAGMARAQLAKRKAERPFNFCDCVHPLPLGYQRLQHSQTIIIGDRVWDIRMGNGHAPEHATFWSRQDAIILGGDQLLPSISPNIGVYPTEPEADPLGEWLASCEAFAPLSRDDQLVLGGHKLPYTGLPTRLRQLAENHHGALARLLAHLSTPRRASECFAPLFKRSIDDGTYGLALAETIAHLNHLQALGKITRTPAADGAWLWQAVTGR